MSLPATQTAPATDPLSPAELFEFFDLTETEWRRWLRLRLVITSTNESRHKRRIAALAAEALARHPDQPEPPPPAETAPAPAQPAARPTVCQHCHAAPISRSRSLCWSCYYAPGVRDLYPSTSKFAHRGAGNGCHPGTTPTPTTASPGTREKVAVLAARAAAGQALFCDGDAPFDNRSRRRLADQRRLLSERSRCGQARRAKSHSAA